MERSDLLRAAYNIISSYATTKNISRIFPGTMEEVFDPITGFPCGITGELGVRHGLQFSLIKGGSKYELASVEVDALDVPISSFVPLDGDSKLITLFNKSIKRGRYF